MRTWAPFRRAIISGAVVCLNLCAASRAPGATVIAWGDYLDGQTSVPSDLSNVVAIAAGDRNGFALRADGTAVGWGYNYFGQSTLPEGLTNLIAIAPSEAFTLALRSDGTVVSWGENYSGETNVPPSATNIIAIASGRHHSLALRSDGTVLGWGANRFGQTDPPPSLRNVVAIAAAGYHSVALRGDGTVVSWGWNDFGTTNIPPGLSNVVAISAGWNRNLALRNDGTVVGWGVEYSEFRVPVDFSNVVAIAAGGIGLALLSDGTVRAWGSMNGPTNVPVSVTGVVAIAAGAGHALALVGDGAPAITVQPLSRHVFTGREATLVVKAVGNGPFTYQWLFNDADIPGATNGTLFLPAVQASDAGAYSVVVSDGLASVTSQPAVITAFDSPPFIVVHPTDQQTYLRGDVLFQVDADGSGPLTYQWRFQGADLPGATNSSLPLENVQSAQAGTYFVVVRGALGTVTSLGANLRLTPIAAWGEDAFGETSVPPGLSGIVDIAAGDYFSVALRSDGRVRAWGFYERSMSFETLSNIVAIAAGGFHGLALKNNGTVLGWANNNWGQAVAGLSNVVAIAAGATHSLALRADGTVAAWGYYTGEPVPPGATNVIAISAGNSYSLALRRDGAVLSWGGDNYYGQNSVPSNLTNAVAISAGRTYSLALRSDGTVVAWGQDSFGRAAVPPDLTNVVAIAAGERENLALLGDGTIVGWNSHRRTVLPPRLSNIVAVAAGRAHGLALVGSGAPIIAVQPVSQQLFSGSELTMRVMAAGSGVLTYQWRLNSAPIPDATNSTLTLPAVQRADVGAYTVLISNAAGWMVSQPATLVVVESPPIISVQPTDQQTLLTGRARFEVQAYGSSPLSYQWQFEGSDIPNATEPWLELEGVRSSWAGRYSVVVRNEFGSVNSSNVTLTVQFVVTWGGGINVISHLTNVIALAGGYDGTFAVTSDGAVIGLRFGLPSLSGLSNITAIAPGTSHLLALRTDGAVLALGNNDYYGQLKVPSNLTNVIAIAAGWNHNLALKSDNTVLAWGDNSRGQTNVPRKLIRVIALAAGGNHSLALRSDGTVAAWGSDEFGQVSGIHNQPNVVSIAAGAQHSVALATDGTVAVFGDNTYGQLQVPSDLTNVVAIAAGWFHTVALRSDGTVTAWGVNGEGQSDVPTDLSRVIEIAAGLNQSTVLLGEGLPVFTLQPVSHTTFTGNLLTLPAMVAGAAPLSYQWQFNGADLPEATNSILTIADVQSAHAGAYTLVVSNGWGIAISQPATLTVLARRPLITEQPAGQNAIPGATAALHVRAEGSGPISYQWRFKGRPIGSETNSTLWITNLQYASAGEYTVRVANSIGSITSATAVVYLQLDYPFARPRLWDFTGAARSWVVHTPGGAILSEGKKVGSIVKSGGKVGFSFSERFRYLESGGLFNAVYADRSCTTTLLLTPGARLLSGLEKCQTTRKRVTLLTTTYLGTTYSAQDVTAPMPDGMSGRWTLSLRVAPAAAVISGSALLSLSNGRVIKFQLTGAWLPETQRFRWDLRTTGASLVAYVRASDMALLSLSGNTLGQTIRWP